MISFDDMQEAIGILGVALSTLKAAVPSQAGRTVAGLHYACGDLLAQAEGAIAGATLFDAERSCFDEAVTAGATLNGFRLLRQAMVATAPNGSAGTYVVGITCSLSIFAEAKVLRDASFTCSDDALSALAVFSAAADVVGQWAANNRLYALYQALIGVAAAVSRDLKSRAAPLPRLTTYSFPRGTTSHALAYRLYGDVGRADELRAEGRVIAPAFMPASGSALSD